MLKEEQLRVLADVREFKWSEQECIVLHVEMELLNNSKMEASSNVSAERQRGLCFTDTVI